MQNKFLLLTALLFSAVALTGSPLAMTGVWMDPDNLGTVTFEK